MVNIQHVFQMSIKYYTIFNRAQYNEWKLHNYIQKAKMSFRSLIVLTFLIISIRLSLLMDTTYLKVTLGLQILVHVLLFAGVTIYQHKHSQMLEFLSLVHHLMVNWFCLIMFDEFGYELAFTAITIAQLHIYRSITIKVFTLVCYGLSIILSEYPHSLEGFYLTLIVALIAILRQEFELMNHFSNIQALFSIIDSIPQAMCIIQTQKKQLLYSNKYFQTLSYALEGFHSDADYSPERLSTKCTRAQLNFLQNLHLTEFNSEGLNLLDTFDCDGLMEDNYRIRKVTYRKNSSPQQDLSLSRETALQFTRPKNNLTQEMFKMFTPHDESFIRKTYTSDVTVQVELRHQPLTCISAAMKKRKKSLNVIKPVKLSQQPSQQVSQLAQTSFKTNRKQSSEHILKDKYLQQLDLIDFNQQSGSLMNHKMKFMVNVMDNYKLIEDSNDMQIYFIQELSPVILKTKLKKLESVKKNLLRSISHELLTNLNAAYGYIKQSQDKQKQEQLCPQQLELALNYVKLQLYKIYDIFDYRDILDDKLIMKKDRIILNTLIHDSIKLIQNQVDRKGLSLTVEIPQKVYYVVGDRQRLCQVMLNLISNAIKFTQTGAIIINVREKCYQNSMECVDDLEVEDGYTNLLEIWVIDSGSGMEEEQLSTLRKKLHVADEDEKVSKESVGIGMGLSVCKQIIKMMAPKNSNLLFVDSVKDAGSQFYFVLKYEDQNPNQLYKSNQFSIPQHEIQCQQVKVMSYHKGSNAAIVNTGNQLHKSEIIVDVPIESCQCNQILIVDDEFFNIEVIEHMVKGMGYGTEYASNGKVAVERVIQKYQNRCSDKCAIYFAILMDINMPVMSGWEAVQRIRQMECSYQMTKTIPIIAVTAFSSMDDQQKCLNEGFNSVILKPATKQKLLEVFESISL